MNNPQTLFMTHLCCTTAGKSLRRGVERLWGKNDDEFNLLPSNASDTKAQVRTELLKMCHRNES